MRAAWGIRGMVWASVLTQTTFSVPSLMGAIMSIGVATANSILLVTFASGLRPGGALRWRLHEGGLHALRPILMTAFAMIVGMLPMALGSERAESRMLRWPAPSSAA